MRTPSEIAGICRELANKKGVSVSSVLEACRINRNFMYDLEHKTVYPSIDKFNRLAEFFGVSADYILGREEMEKPAGFSDGGRSEEFMRLFHQLSDAQKELVVRTMQEMRRKK